MIRLPEMYYIVAECVPSASESADALNTVRFARGISYSDEIPTTGYDDLDNTSEEDKNQTKRINEIMKEYRNCLLYTSLEACYIHNKKYKEVAEELNVSVAAIHKNIVKALRRCV